MLSMFNNSNDTILVGSDSSEVKYDSKEARELIQMDSSKSCTTRWNFSNAEIFTRDEAAWALSIDR